jgi:hypothetical protein
MNDSQKRKLIWIILGIIVLAFSVYIKASFHSRDIQMTPTPVKIGGFSCVNTEGPCEGKSLLGKCETSEGKNGVCIGKLTNQWKFDCTCQSSSKGSIAEN